MKNESVKLEKNPQKGRKMDVGLIVALLIAGVINVVILLKFWRMTNDVKGIHKLIFAKEALLREDTAHSQGFLKDRVNRIVIKELSRHEP
jgi:hypothetical protein